MVPASMARIPNFANRLALLRRQRADAADLNPDRTEIRKAAQRKRRNGKLTADRASLLQRARVAEKATNSFTTMRVPSKISDRRAIVPRNSDHPSHRREHPAENLLQADTETSIPMCRKPVVRPAHASR